MPAVMKEEIQVPDGVEIRMEGNTAEVSGPRGKIRKEFRFEDVGVKMDGEKIIVEAKRHNKVTKAALGTVKAHFRNMFKGVKEGFVYKLRVVYSHFPITVKVDGKKVLIQNFIGERYPRTAKIIGDVEVEVAGDIVLVRGIDKDEVGQTAINIERSTSVRYKDRRVFQDGCYIVEKV